MEPEQKSQNPATNPAIITADRPDPPPIFDPNQQYLIISAMGNNNMVLDISQEPETQGQMIISEKQGQHGC